MSLYDIMDAAYDRTLIVNNDLSAKQKCTFRCDKASKEKSPGIHHGTGRCVFKVLVLFRLSSISSGLRFRRMESLLMIQ